MLFCWEARGLGMLADEVLAGRPVDTVDLVVRYVALDPLNVGTEVAEDRTRRLGRTLKIACTEFANAGHFPFNHELRRRYFLSASCLIPAAVT